MPFPTPPRHPRHQEAFASQFRRLADAKIPTVLLVGNHDQHGQGLEGNSLGIYRTLSVPNFFVGDRLRTLAIATRSGPIQITTLPWLNRSTLLTNPETEGLSVAAVAASLLEKLNLALEAETRQLDRAIPAVLLAHAMVDRARYGAERHLAIGKGFTIPLHLLARPAYQYVALGHVHSHQVLCQNPPVIYPGSIERVDFSEEREAKGFVLANITAAGTEYEFVTLKVRNFCTIRIDLATLAPDASPMAALEAAIAKQDITGAVVRAIYRIRPDCADEIDSRRLHELLAPASSYTISAETLAPERTRLPGLAATDLTPLEALEQYLQTREDLSGLQEDMLQAARQVIEATSPDWEVNVSAPTTAALWETEAEQLSLWAAGDSQND